MAQTDQRNAGITTSTHQINIGAAPSDQNGGISMSRSHLRGLSSSPPPLRSFRLSDEYCDLGDRTPQRQHSWIIRRQPPQLDSRNCGTTYHNRSDVYQNNTNQFTNSNTNRHFRIHPSASDLCPARSHADVERSIHTVALTGPTKAVSILIGGTTKSSIQPTANPSDCTRSSCDSPRHVPVSPSPRALHGLGISVDNPSISIANGGGLQFAVRPVASSPALVRHSASPVTVGVSTTGTVVLSRVSDNPLPLRQQVLSTPFVNVARIQRRNSTSTCLPPRPRFEFESNSGRNGSALVRISSTQGRGVVVTASSVRGLQFQTPSRIIRFASPPPRGTILRPSGSCDSLLGDRFESNLIALEPVGVHRQPIRHAVLHASVGEANAFVARRPASHIILRDSTIAALNCDMPNVPPSTVSVGAAKANCSPQTRLSDHIPGSRSPFLHESMSGERVTPFTDASGNVLRVSPITVTSPASHKPLPPAGRSTPSDAHRHHKANAKHSQYFRVQLPCTRATSRSTKGFVVTDSLKLYEDQIFNYCQAQRPQSWCIDFGGLNDELALIDDSASGSPASTVSSSYSSSSSSDASQSPSYYVKQGQRQQPLSHHHNHQQQQHSKPASTVQSRIFRWPVNLESTSANRPRPDGDDMVTPTSTPTGNGPVNIALGTCSEPPSPQLPPRPSAIIRALNNASKPVTVIGPDPIRPSNGQPVAVLSTGPLHPSESPIPKQPYPHHHPVVLESAAAAFPDSNGGSSSSTSNFSSGFETVRPVHVTAVVPRPQPNFSSAFPNPTPIPVESCVQPETDVQSVSTVSTSEDSSTATLSSAHPIGRIPQSVENVAGTPVPSPPPVMPSPTHSSDGGHKGSDNGSLANSESLVLPPPSPWNVSDASDLGPGNAALNHSAVGPPSMFMNANVADRVSPENNSACEGLLPSPVRRHSHDSLNGHPHSAHLVHSEPVLPTNPLGLAFQIPQPGAPHPTPPPPAPLAVFTEMDTFGSDPFSSSPEFTKVEDLESESMGMLSSMAADENTYAFSTLDSEYLAWMRLNVRDVTGMKLNGPTLSALDLDSVNSLRRAQVHHWVDLFNSNPLGLRLNFVDDSCRLAGTLRIYINLIKPVKMSLRQTMEMLPAPQPTPSGENQLPAEMAAKENSHEAQPDIPAPARLVSFFLPRGTSKVVYITSATTAVNAIQSLLDRFHIQESARKFALYEHTLEENTIVARKLAASECPLMLLLNWVRQCGSREQFLELLRQKRIVLQENDACDIDWKDFTAAELTNFLRILDKEEAEYKNAILYQYGLLRHQLEERLSELDKQAVTAGGSGSRYTRVGCSGHPHAYSVPDPSDLSVSNEKSDSAELNGASGGASPAASV